MRGVSVSSFPPPAPVASLPPPLLEQLHEDVLQTLSSVREVMVQWGDAHGLNLTSVANGIGVGEGALLAAIDCAGGAAEQVRDRGMVGTLLHMATLGSPHGHVGAPQDFHSEVRNAANAVGQAYQQDPALATGYGLFGLAAAVALRPGGSRSAVMTIETGTASVRRATVPRPSLGIAPRTPPSLGRANTGRVPMLPASTVAQVPNAVVTAPPALASSALPQPRSMPGTNAVPPQLSIPRRQGLSLQPGEGGEIPAIPLDSFPGLPPRIASQLHDPGRLRQAAISSHDPNLPSGTGGGSGPALKTFIAEDGRLYPDLSEHPDFVVIHKLDGLVLAEKSYPEFQAVERDIGLAKEARRLIKDGESHLWNAEYTGRTIEEAVQRGRYDAPAMRQYYVDLSMDVEVPGHRLAVSTTRVLQPPHPAGINPQAMTHNAFRMFKEKYGDYPTAITVYFPKVLRQEQGLYSPPDYRAMSLSPSMRDRTVAEAGLRNGESGRRDIVGTNWLIVQRLMQAKGLTATEAVMRSPFGQTIITPYRYKVAEPFEFIPEAGFLGVVVRDP
jgi:hypothetical protein